MITYTDQEKIDNENRIRELLIEDGGFLEKTLGYVDGRIRENPEFGNGRDEEIILKEYLPLLAIIEQDLLFGLQSFRNRLTPEEKEKGLLLNPWTRIYYKNRIGFVYDDKKIEPINAAKVYLEKYSRVESLERAMGRLSNDFQMNTRSFVFGKINETEPYAHINK